MYLILHPVFFMLMNKTTPAWNSGLTVLDLHKGPYKACRKAGDFLGLHPQEGVCKKNKDAGRWYPRLAKPGKD